MVLPVLFEVHSGVIIVGGARFDLRPQELILRVSVLIVRVARQRPLPLAAVGALRQPEAIPVPSLPEPQYDGDEREAEQRQQSHGHLQATHSPRVALILRRWQVRL